MKFLKHMTAALCAAALISSLIGCGSETKTASALRLGTGGIGGTYYTYGSALNQLLSDNADDMKLTVKSTAGSAANVRLLSKGFLELGLVQSDILTDAASGQGLFEQDGAVGGYSCVAGLYTEACQIIVPADSDIETIADLQGRTVSVGEEESGVVRNAQQILQAYGLTFKNIDVKYLSFADSASAMEKGDIEAFFCTAGAPTNAVTELSHTMNIRLLPVEDAQTKQLLGLYDGFTDCTIPAGTYAGQDSDVKTIGVKAVLVASDKVDAGQIKELTAALFDHASELKYATGANTDTDINYAVENIPVGFHPGAAAYYRENGIEVTEGSANGSTGVSGSQD